MSSCKIEFVSHIYNIKQRINNKTLIFCSTKLRPLQINNGGIFFSFSYKIIVNSQIKYAQIYTQLLTKVGFVWKKETIFLESYATTKNCEVQL